MNGLKKTFALISLCVLTLFVLSSLTDAKMKFKRLEILNAFVDWGTEPPVLVIKGHNFGKNPEVWLDEFSLEIISSSGDNIEATLPVDIGSGTYRLLVSDKHKKFRHYVPRTDTMDVTIITEGLEGPQGPQGEPGPPGEKGDKGDTGEKGDPGANGISCWDINGNGTCDPIEDKNGGGCDASDCQGPQGIQGPEGPRGDTGEKGDKGDKGDQGEPGVDGKDGAPGIGDLLGKECPTGEVMVGFNADGTLKCQCDGFMGDCDHDGVSYFGGDCDDADPDMYPGNPEICDQKDNDCNGQIDEGISIDADGDGKTICDGDCDDANPLVYPGQTAFFSTERAGGGYDYNCDEVEELEHPYLISWSYPECRSGWINTIPACGGTAQWRDLRGRCEGSGEEKFCECIPLDDPIPAIQQCR